MKVADETVKIIVDIDKETITRIFNVSISTQTFRPLSTYTSPWLVTKKQYGYDKLAEMIFVDLSVPLSHILIW